MSNEGYSLVYNTIKDTLEANPLVNKFGEGMGDEIDLSKQTLFPLSYMVMETATPDGNAVQFTFTLYAMDIVDISDSGINNKHSVMNTQYNVLLRLYEDLRRGDLWDKKVQLVGFNMQAFEQAYSNLLAGWSASITLYVPNHMTIC